jgi:ABC-type branched-subunit amino acid transport system ATPase component
MNGEPTHRVALAGIAMVPEGRGIFPKPHDLAATEKPDGQ